MSKENHNSSNTDVFSGVIGQEYDLLKLICPLSAEMSRLVGVAVNQYCSNSPVTAANVVELGGGTGITTLAILLANEQLSVLSIDNEPTMQKQAKSSLKNWAEQGRLAFSEEDALSALKKIDSDSVDIIASAYTTHNFIDQYRDEVVEQIFRVLKPGGQFINGDRYALDDVTLHTETIQQEVAGYFSVLTKLNKLDVLEHWIIHLFNDESENHVMREAIALQQLEKKGFVDINLSHRMEVNALVTANKP